MRTVIDVPEELLESPDPVGALEHRSKAALIRDAIVCAMSRIQGWRRVSRHTRGLKSDWPDVRIPYRLRFAQLPTRPPAKRIVGRGSMRS